MARAQEAPMRHVSHASVVTLALVAALSSMQSVSLDARQAAAGGVPSGEPAPGSVTIGRSVTADGKPLKSGTYRLRLTPETAAPAVPGQTPQLERWVEFLQGSKVVG